MGLFKKKIPPVPTKAQTEVVDATIKEKAIDYKAEYEKLTKQAEKPQEAQEVPKIEEKEPEEDRNKDEEVLKNYKTYVTLEPDQAETIKINLLLGILNELKKLNDKTI